MIYIDHSFRDYVMVLPSPDPHDPELESISLDELRGAATFIIMRNRAMCSGDESALYYVYRVLQNFNSLPGAEAIMQTQLKKEYGQPFGRMLMALENGTPLAPPEVSLRDVDTAICFLKQLGRFQEELEDYVPGTEGKKAVQVGVQVNRFCSNLIPVTYFFVGPGGRTKEGLDRRCTMARRCYVALGFCLASGTRPTKETFPEGSRAHRPQPQQVTSLSSFVHIS
jgi:hypothetical protein